MAKVQTLKVSFGISRHANRDRFSGRDESERVKPLGSQIVVINALRGAYSASTMSRGEGDRAAVLWLSELSQVPGD